MYPEFKKGIREYGHYIGEGKTGKRNLLTDVPGVRVGHCTINTADHKTGVTVILPCEGLIYQKKPVAAVYTLNGYGKTTGTIQLEELGVLESPVALTNTLNVGKVADALVEYAKGECDREGVRMTSINTVVGETNDARLNRITDRVIEEKHVFEAIANAAAEFGQGSVGAGRGTVCFGLKGGIGSASRVLSFGKEEYVLGVLVQSNFGRTKDLCVGNVKLGERIAQQIREKSENDQGSIMVVLGTDIPLTARQLKRVLKRAAVGLVRTGSFMGHGSGDVFLGFTNGNYMPESEALQFQQIRCFPENQIDKVFRLAAEATEEAILNSLVYADPDTGIGGEKFHSLREFL